MDEIVTIDEQGHLTLPESIRRALRLSSPTDFRAEMSGNKVELVPLSSSQTVLKRSHGLLVASPGGDSFNAAEAVEKARQERL